MPTAGRILTITCPDTVGIVAAVAGFLSDQGWFINESSHFGDVATGRFFMRTVFTASDAAGPDELFRARFPAIAERFAMDWRLADAAHRPRVMILVSRFDHCLNDLLYRYRTGALAMAVVGIVSNHPDLKPLADWHAIPYHHLPVMPKTKGAQEAALAALVGETDAELIVLARYMQILTPGFCAGMPGRIINIHHSFLPGFKGARPYHQAHRRGVKLIGATAHYVTEDLDEGPIIEQAVERVDHTFTPDQLIAVGRDIECRVLAGAVRYHLEHRVLLNGNKTVVFR